VGHAAAAQRHVSAGGVHARARLRSLGRETTKDQNPAPRTRFHTVVAAAAATGRGRIITHRLLRDDCLPAAGGGLRRCGVCGGLHGRLNLGGVCGGHLVEVSWLRRFVCLVVDFVWSEWQISELALSRCQGAVGWNWELGDRGKNRGMGGAEICGATRGAEIELRCEMRRDRSVFVPSKRRQLQGSWIDRAVRGL
jgi:hypothetical protein